MDRLRDATAQGLVAFHFDVDVAMAEIGTWPPELIARFFAGIADAQRAVTEARAKPEQAGCSGNHQGYDAEIVRLRADLVAAEEKARLNLRGWNQDSNDWDAERGALRASLERLQAEHDCGESQAGAGWAGSWRSYVNALTAQIDELEGRNTELLELRAEMRWILENRVTHSIGHPIQYDPTCAEYDRRCTELEARLRLGR